MASKGKEKSAGKTDKKFEKFTIVTVWRSEIRVAEYNPRVITPEALKLIRENIKKVGLLDAIIWNKTTGNLVSGHQRLQCLDALNGRKEDYQLTVAQVELDEKTEKEQNVFLNNPFAQGSFDQIKLPELLKEIDIDKTGFSAADVHREWGEDVLKDKPEDLLEMSKRIDEFSGRLNAEKARTDARDDTDFYLVLVFKNHDERKAYTDKLGLQDELFQDPAAVTDRIKAAP